MIPLLLTTFSNISLFIPSIQLLLYTFSGISLFIPSIPLLLTTFSGIALFIPSIQLLLYTFSGISLFIPSIPLNLCQQIKKTNPSLGIGQKLIILISRYQLHIAGLFYHLRIALISEYSSSSFDSIFSYPDMLPSQLSEYLHKN